MEGKIYFLFAVHNHQPVGNFDAIFEKSYKYGYEPFLNLLEKYPAVSVALHISGCLADWIKFQRPEYFRKLKDLVWRGQVELICGGYYEPILPSIPQKDRILQIKKGIKFIQDEFGILPKGFWVAERVWEPTLVKILVDMGMEYTFLDEEHFYWAGVQPDKIHGYYLVEDEGVILKIFPISKQLRYIIPFSGHPQVVMDYFHQVLKKINTSSLTLADDGEKFGIWPKTYEHVYEKGWLENFFQLISQNKNEGWFGNISFSEYISKFPPTGSIYLPTASYFEMSEWSLPVESGKEFRDVLEYVENLNEHDRNKIKRFLRGGIWRNFFVKYPESSNMHKKMLYVSFKLESIMDEKSEEGKIEEAINSLLKGQCNCAYWHGVFGGLYLPHLRKAVYSNLIHAEKSINDILYKRDSWASYEVKDYNLDAKDEVILSNEMLNVYILPHYGGSICELDFLESEVNVCNTLSRREEVYHDIIRKKLWLHVPDLPSDGIKTIHQIIAVKERDLENYLCYDWYLRYSLLDHFIHPDTRFENFICACYGEQGDFVNQPYTVGNVEIKDEVRASLYRKGIVWVGEEKVDIYVHKELILKKNVLDIIYTLKNLSHREHPHLWFGVEFNFAFFDINEKGVLAEVDFWEKSSPGENYRVKLCFSPKVDLWFFPIYTVSASESGFERTLQGLCVLPNIRLQLAKDVPLKLNIRLMLEKVS